MSGHDQIDNTDAGSDAAGLNRKSGDGALSGRVARGTAWIVGARLVMRVFGFLNTIVVAYLLVPEDFGLVALGLTMMQLLQGFSEIGVSQAVVKFRDADRSDLDTLFTLSALRGMLIAAILLIAAPFAAEFYGDHRVMYVFAGIAIYPVLTGLINPKFFEFERDLDFSREFWVLVLNKLAGVAVSIVVAFVFRTYWAIVLGLLTNGLVQLVLSYGLMAYRPRFSLASFRKVVGFSGWLTGVSFAAALNNKLDVLILGRTAGAQGAGNFYIGLQLAGLPTSELAYPMSRALYPGLSELQGRRAKMRIAYLGGVEALGAIALPAAIGFAFVAHELISLLLGAKWIGAVPVVEIITPALGFQALFLATQHYAMALGKTKLVFFREMAFFLIRTPIIISAALSDGIVGAAYAVAGTGIIHAILNMTLYHRVSGANRLDPLWAARRSLVAVAGMAVSLCLLESVLGDAQSLLIALGVKIVVGVLVFTGIAGGLWRLEGRPEGVEKTLLHMIKSKILGRAR